MNGDILPTNYIAERRAALRLTESEVAKALGIKTDELRAIEKRGELPEVHFRKLSKVLRVSVTDLYIEKYAPIFVHIFLVSKRDFRQLVQRAGSVGVAPRSDLRLREIAREQEMSRN